MSVKGKVKRANKEIEELKNRIKELEQYQYISIKAEDEELKIIKDNFIKMILNGRKPLEDSCAVMRISRGQLDTMKEAILEIERDYTYPNSIIFKLRV